MLEIVEIKNIFLDSRNKTTGNAYDFTYSLNNGDPFFNCSPNEKMMVNLTSFQINNDFFNIRTDNNQFGVAINTILNPSSNPLIACKISITPGYYDVYNLIDELQSIMTTEINDTFGTYDGGTYTFTINIEYVPNTSKLKWTITATNNFFDTYNLFFLFKDTVIDTGGDLFLTGPPLQFLGFSSENDRPAVFDNEINSNTQVNMVLQPTIFIKSNLVKDNKEYYNDGTNQLLRATNTLCIIDINVPKLSNIQYVDYNNNFETEAINSINEINFRFVDEDNNIIEFLGNNRISLKFTKYKENKEIVENIIKISELKEAELLFNQMTTLLTQKEQQRDIDILEEQQKERENEEQQIEQIEKEINEENE